MHAVIREYTGHEVIDLITESAAEVEELLRDVEGFSSYTAVKTADGAVTITVCEDQEGTLASTRVAKDFLASKGVTAAPPQVTEGPVELYFTEE